VYIDSRVCNTASPLEDRLDEERNSYGKVNKGEVGVVDCRVSYKMVIFYLLFSVIMIESTLTLKLASVPLACPICGCCIMS
jgi:hypothetical protein